MEAPELHAPHKAQSGHKGFDIAMTLAATIVSGVSLYMGIDNGNAMEKLVAANSWPNVRADVSVLEGKDPGTLRFVVTVVNSGVGPALVETLEVWVGDKAIASSSELIRAMKQEAAIEGPATARFDAANVVGSFLGAKERQEIHAFAPSADERWFEGMVRMAEKLETRICYCSVFDECSVADSRLESARPAQVKVCPKPPVLFRDTAAEMLPFLERPKAGDDGSKAVAK